MKTDKTALNARVAQRFEVAPGLMVMRVVPEERELAEFRAGQFAVLGLPFSAPRCSGADPELEEDNGKMIRRAYSIASSSVDLQYLEFYITLVKSGALTPRLFALDPGDGLWLGPKITGSFTLDQAPKDRNVILVATGTGLAPYMSMLRTVLAVDRDRHFVVLLGARHSWDLGYHAELVAMERLSATFTYIPVISEPEEEPVPWKGATGWVTALFKDGTLREAIGFEPKPANSSVFLCGNPAMIEDMCSLLEADGFRENSRTQAGEIFVEKYW